ncbi:uncharacterized protein LOC141632688 [Silene latifolia]|uniref:uncharacterized protein LOC141632688 n=1 Tax=Silene latifolia TaxID=37657 RepID=UPI003D78B075
MRIHAIQKGDAIEDLTLEPDLYDDIRRKQALNSKIHSISFKRYTIITFALAIVGFALEQFDCRWLPLIVAGYPWLSLVASTPSTTWLYKSFIVGDRSAGLLMGPQRRQRAKKNKNNDDGETGNKRKRRCKERGQTVLDLVSRAVKEKKTIELE